KLMESNGDRLTGVVEIDEAYIANRPVLGAIERGGNVKIKVANDMGGAGISAHAIRNISTDAKIMSDNNRAYAWLDRHYEREYVTPSKEYTRGKIHINTMETVWSHVKKSIKGTHNHVSPKHLQSYLDFFSFHHDNRASSVAPFLVLLTRACR
ncbi:MAG: IS1595 family transposase, partial [Patescibacteria group bacterium]